MDELMRILLVDDTLNVGGKERLLLTALRCLPRDRMSVHLCLTGSPGALGEEALSLADGSLVCNRGKPFSPSAAGAIRRYIDSERIDILHCNGTVDLLHAWAATRGTGAKLVCSVHGYASGVHLHLGRFLLGRCDAVLPVSDSLLSDLRRDGYRARLFAVIPNCYDPAFETGLPRSSPSPAGTLKLICVSRFDWSKDQVTLVRALRTVVDSGRDVTIDFAGSGPDEFTRPVSDAVSECAVADRVGFLGTCDDIPALLRGYDAFILSSFAESFGIAAVEAMACGLPVALSDIAPFREILRGGEDGLLFEPGSPDAAASCISTLCDDPERRALLSRRSLERSKAYSPETFASRLTGFYAGLLGRDGTAIAGRHAV
jgi:glycosyltransferase involved in cell wall biosynthesis